jgi:hypothetical protein
MTEYCSCLETKGVQNVPRWHNCEYINSRKKLIPIAEKKAKLNSTKEDGKINELLFTNLFARYMEELAVENKLI